MFNMAFLHLKRMFKNKKTVIIMILIPTFVVGFVTYLTNGGTASKEFSNVINVVNYDKGEYGQKLIKELEEEDGFNVQLAELKDSQNDVKENKIAAAIIIPEKFSKNINNYKSMQTMQIKILKLKESNTQLAIEQKINKFIFKNKLSKDIVLEMKKNNVKVNTNYEKVQKDINKYLNEKKIDIDFKELKNSGTITMTGSISVNLIINFLLYSMIYIVMEIYELKKNKTLRRSLSTPNKNYKIVGAILLSMLFLCWIQVGILVLVTKFIFKLYWGKSLLSIFLIFTALILVVLSMGLVVSRWIKNSSQASGVVNLIVTPTCMVSGCFMPLQFLPKIFQKIAYFTPQNWAMTALTDVTLKNSGVLDILPKVGVLLLFALVFFTAGAKTLQNIIQE